jgi:hypothetical protein
MAMVATKRCQSTLGQLSAMRFFDFNKTLATKRCRNTGGRDGFTPLKIQGARFPRPPGYPRNTTIPTHDLVDRGEYGIPINDLVDRGDNLRARDARPYGGCNEKSFN